MKKRILFLMLFLSIQVSLFAQVIDTSKIPQVGCGTTTDYILNINRDYGSSKDMIDQVSFPTGGIVICKHFRLYFDDYIHGNEGFFDNYPMSGSTIGALRRNTLCEVISYIESVIKIELPAGEYIDIFVGQSYTTSNPMPTGQPQSGALAMAGPYFPIGTFGNLQGIYEGNAFNHIMNGVNGILPPNTDPDPLRYDGNLVVNFNIAYAPNGDAIVCNYYDDYLNTSSTLKFDLYSILLHEFTHVLGWISAIKEDNSIPNQGHAIVANNSFTLFDSKFLYKGDILHPSTLVQLVQPGPVLLSSINSVDFPLRNMDIWMYDNGVPFNQPVFSGYQTPTTYLLPGVSEYFPCKGSLLSHLAYVSGSFQQMAQFSPGYLPKYVMGPFGCEEQFYREWAIPEIRALHFLGYQYNPSFLTDFTLNDIIPTDVNSNVINNTSAYRSNNINRVTDPNFITRPSENSFTHRTFTPNYPSITSTTIDVINDVNIQANDDISDNESNSISIMPGSLFGIRGVSLNGNNHDRLSINSGMTQVTYTPEPGYIGRAQFGFNLWDGHEKGALMIVTIDVQPGNYVASFGDELIINGNFEDGTEVKQTINGNYLKPYTSRRDCGIEGEYYMGYQFSGAHPFCGESTYNTGYIGEVIQESWKRPSNIFTPQILGFFGNYGQSYQITGTNNYCSPTTDPLTNERYEIINKSERTEISTLKNPMFFNHYYQIEFDLATFIHTPKNAGDIINMQLDIMENPSPDPLAAVVYQNIPYAIVVQNTTTSTSSDWQHFVATFRYCGTLPASYIRLFCSETDLYYDNISIREIAAPSLTASISGNSIICIGSTTNLTAMPSSVDCNTTYYWMPGGNTTQTITTQPLSSSMTYSVIITNAFGVTATATIDVTQAPDISFSNVLFPCNGASNGEATIVANGGTPPYNYTWGTTPIQYTAFVNNLSVGTYDVTVTDAAGCSNTSQIIIKEGQIPTFAFGPTSVPELCSGENTLIYCDVYYSDQVTTWTVINNPGGIIGASNGGPITGPFSIIQDLTNPGLTPATITYELTSTLGACSYTFEYDVTVNPLPNIGVTCPTDQYCHRSDAYLFANGGVSYSWSGPNGFISYLQSPIVENLDLDDAGTYTVLVTNEFGCTNTASCSFTVNPISAYIANDILAIPNPVCEGGLLQLKTVIPIQAGTSITWLGPGNFTSNLYMPSFNAQLNNSGQYEYIQLYNGQCHYSNINVVVNPNPIPNIVVSNSTICAGQSAVLTASGGNTYQWSSGTTPSNTAVTTVTPSVTSTYTVIVSNSATSCSGTASTTINVNPIPVVHILPANYTSCNGAPVTITASGGGTYLWSTGATTSSITVTPQAGSTNVYTVIVTNAANCTATATSSITYNLNAQNIIPVIARVCAGESITLTGCCGTGYLWSNGATTSSITVTPASSTTYAVTVTFAGGCTSTMSRLVTVNPLPQLFVVSGGGAYCSGGSGLPIYLSGSQSGVNYQLKRGTTNVGSLSGTGSTLTWPLQTIAGTYTVVATNVSTGCTRTMSGSAIITIKPLPTATAVHSIPVCANGTLQLFASSGTSYSYSWSCPGGWASSLQNPTRTPPVSNVYTVIVTHANGCTKTASTNVTVTPISKIIVTSNSPVMVGGTLNLGTSSGLSYNWSGPGGWSANTMTPSRLNMQLAGAGTYYVTVTQTSFCTATGSVNVVVNSSPIANNSTQINTEEFNNNLKIYPNPNNGSFVIESEQSGRFVLYNSIGVVLESFELNSENEKRVMIEGLSAGLYFIKDIKDIQGKTYKVVIFE